MGVFLQFLVAGPAGSLTNCRKSLIVVVEPFVRQLTVSNLIAMQSVCSALSCDRMNGEHAACTHHTSENTSNWALWCFKHSAGLLVFAYDKVLSILNLCSSKRNAAPVFNVILAVSVVQTKRSVHHLFVLFISVFRFFLFIPVRQFTVTAGTIYAESRFTKKCPQGLVCC
jgi:hypothetical protein